MTASSVVIVCLFLVLVVESLPLFRVQGTHYEVGFKVGQQFAKEINTFVDGYAYLQSEMIPFFETTEGKNLVEDFTEVNQKEYPNYFEELRGLSDGSSIPFYVLLLLNLRPELEFWINQVHKSSLLNCADIHVNFQDNVFVGHNEDSSPSIKQTAYLLQVEIPESGENFTAYTYPGVLPGLAFGWNEYLSFSFNFVFPIPVKVGLARAFINRHALGSSSVQDAISRVTPQNRAFGFTLNLGDFRNRNSFSLEISPEIYSVFQVQQNFSHFNEYKTLNIVQDPDTSTPFRQSRADQFAPPKSAEDILQVLGDTENSNWPIFRNGNAPDHVSTVATVLFDLGKKIVSIWQANPKANSPEIIISL